MESAYRVIERFPVETGLQGCLLKHRFINGQQTGRFRAVRCLLERIVGFQQSLKLGLYPEMLLEG